MRGINLTRLGIGASVLCGIHCALLPVVAGASCFAGLNALHSPWVEGSMLGVTSVVGLGTLGFGFRRHGNVRPLVLLVLGLAVLFLKHQFLPESWHTLAAVAGAVVVAGAQWLNHRCPAPCCSVGACSGDARANPLPAEI